MKWVVLLLLSLTAGCDALPRDPAETTQRIKTSREFTVGFADAHVRAASEATRLLSEIERRTSARPRFVALEGEPLLKALDAGEVDLVIGRFAEDSPWATEVAFGPALATGGPKGDRQELKAAMRNGENRWIMTVERASRAISAEARRQ